MHICLSSSCEYRILWDSNGGWRISYPHSQIRYDIHAYLLLKFSPYFPCLSNESPHRIHHYFIHFLHTIIVVSHESECSIFCKWVKMRFWVQMSWVSFGITPLSWQPSITCFHSMLIHSFRPTRGTWPDWLRDTEGEHWTSPACIWCHVFPIHANKECVMMNVFESGRLRNAWAMVGVTIVKG